MKDLSPDQIFLLNRASRDEKYLAYSLMIYMQHKDVNWSDLAKELNCGEKHLLKLALCRRIDIQSSNFKDMVQILVTYTDTDAFNLSNMLKKAEFSAFLLAERVALIPSKGGTFLAAAREKNNASSKDKI